MENTISLNLTKEEALVLFEFLSRYEESGELAILHQAENRVLWDALALLEKELVEPFRPDYLELLDSARKKLAF